MAVKVVHILFFKREYISYMILKVVINPVIKRKQEYNSMILTVSESRLMNAPLCSENRWRSPWEVEAPFSKAPRPRSQGTPVASGVRIRGTSVQWLTSASHKGISFSDAYSITPRCARHCIHATLLVIVMHNEGIKDES